MNTRQKAKHYKKAYEELLKQPVRQYVVEHPVDTLHFKKSYPMEIVDSCNEERLEELIDNDVKRGFMDGIGPYVDWKVEKDILNQVYVLNCQLKVVSRNKIISDLPNGLSGEARPLMVVMHE